MIIDLSNKTAIVCGSTRGIGRAIALQFAASGANVILNAELPVELIHQLSFNFNLYEELKNKLATNFTNSH